MENIVSKICIKAEDVPCCSTTEMSYVAFDYLRALRVPYPDLELEYDSEKDGLKCKGLQNEADAKLETANRQLDESRLRLSLLAADASVGVGAVGGAAVAFLGFVNALRNAQINSREVAAKVEVMRDAIQREDYSEYAAYCRVKMCKEQAEQQRLSELQEVAGRVLGGIDPAYRAFLGQDLLCDSYPVKACVNRIGVPCDRGCTFSVGELVGYCGSDAGGRTYTITQWLAAFVVEVEKVRGTTFYWVAFSAEVPFKLARVINVDLEKCSH